jgi:hypothetical protein
MDGIIIDSNLIITRQDTVTSVDVNKGKAFRYGMSEK